MPYYDPHVKPNIRDEGPLFTRGGRLVKVRFLDQPVPNVSWFWFPLGNCTACKFLSPEPKCLNPKITPPEFSTYNLTNTCPEFAAGVSDELLADGRQDRLDAMKAAGLVSGTPSQRVRVIRNEEWTLWRAMRAHREASAFLAMAHAADRAKAENNPNLVHPADVDLSDDLERPAPGPVSTPP